MNVFIALKGSKRLIYFTIYGRGGHLGHVTQMSRTNFRSPYPLRLHTKFDWPSALSPTGSALLRTDLSPLTNGIWVIHARCSCFLHLHLLAKIG